MVLATAMAVGDKEAAKRHNCATRTIRHWRKRIETDADLAADCRSKKELAEIDWAEQLPGAIRGCIDYLKRAAESSEITPDMVHSVAGALKILNDTAVSRRVLDARLRKLEGPTAEVVPLRPVADAPADAEQVAGA
jgi:hypothetical protein